MQRMTAIILGLFGTLSICMPTAASAKSCLGHYEVFWRTSATDRVAYSVYSRAGTYTDDGDCQAHDRAFQMVRAKQAQGYDVRVIKSLFGSREVLSFPPRKDREFISLDE